MSVRTLVVDDSATMRKLIGSFLRQHDGIEVVGEAGDPHEARAAIKALNPDVMTLDVEMPGMNGLEFLEKVMRLRPMPVVMVSTLTQRGASASMRALEIGAFDCIAKGVAEGPGGFGGLAQVVLAAAAAGPAIQRRHTRQATPAVSAGAYESDGRVVVIGASTGGVEVLSDILAAFPANCPPTMIVQHMPPLFTARFATRLNERCAPTVLEATDGAPVQKGTVYIAPGGPAHLQIAGRTAHHCRLWEGPTVSGHRPSADVLFQSACQVLGGDAVGVILTGMGRDGASGLLQLREAGALTLGQDEASSIVYGMPRVAQEIGAVQKQVPAARVAQEILARTNRLQAR